MRKRSLLARPSTFNDESYELKGILDKAEGDTPDDTEHEHTDKMSPSAQADEVDDQKSLENECSTETKRLILTESARQLACMLACKISMKMKRIPKIVKAMMTKRS
jgi:hypothetical protein